MERRRFLATTAGLGGALWLGGCGGGGGDGDGLAQPTAPGTPTTPNPPGGPDWSVLERQLQGQLLRPGQNGFETLRLPANARFDALRPLALVRCASAADVAAALDFARQQQLRPIPRGGGHSYVDASTGEGLIIDVAPMSTVRLEGEVAVIGAGATLADVYGGLIAAGRCVASGSCVSVGIAGITLGGGFGVLDRRYGLGCDQLLGARITLADGRQLDCSASENAELFWALRGAGGGHFGIVSELRLQTHALSALSEAVAQFTLDDLPAVLDRWQRWNPPDWIWSQLALSPDGSLRLWCLASAETSALLPLWQALLAGIGATPRASNLRAREYRELMLEGCGPLALPQCHLPAQRSQGQLGRVAMAASSDFFDAPLNAAGMQALAGGLRQRGRQPGIALLNLMGGAMARVSAESSAFAHRGALFSAQYLAEYGAGTDAATLDAAAAWAHGMRQGMAPWSSGRAYQNYPDLLIPDAPAAYHGAALERLRALKARYDPQRLFQPPQGL